MYYRCAQFGQTKRADYTEHQKLAGAWLSLQNDVLCNRLWRIKVGFCFIQLPPTEPKAWWSSAALSVYRYRVGQIRLIMSQYGGTFLFSCYVAAYRCAIIIQIMCYAVKVVKTSHCIRNFKKQISTVAEKFSLPVRTFSREISTGKKNSVQPGQNFQNPLPTNLDGSQNHTSVQIGQKLKS